MKNCEFFNRDRLKSAFLSFLPSLKARNHIMIRFILSEIISAMVNPGRLCFQAITTAKMLDLSVNDWERMIDRL